MTVIETDTDERTGAFSDSPPWRLSPDELGWQHRIDLRRAVARRRVPELTKPRRMPPGMRVVKVVRKVGGAVAAWRLRDHGKGREHSRAGIAWRLRAAAEDLGPAYIKLGQIIASGGDGVFPEELVSRVPQVP